MIFHDMAEADGQKSPRRYVFKPDPHSSHSIILRWLGDGRGRSLLDVGSADGVLSHHLTARGWRVTCIERDPELAAAGAAHCERMITADLDREVPALEGRFDTIVYADVLEHLADPLAVLVALNRAVKPDGEVIISVPNVAHLWIRLSLLAGHFDYMDRGVLDRTHLRFFTNRSLLTLVSAAGLRVTRTTASPAPLYKVVPPRWHGRVLAALDGFSAGTARLLPRVLGYQLILRARPDAAPGGPSLTAAGEGELTLPDERRRLTGDSGS
jgi:2-polyprenyl-3-methyl-5-hydroxy-6-metoxy-1,4-benzoquinol methylase